MKEFGFLFILVLLAQGCRATAPAVSPPADPLRLKQAIDATLADARHAIDARGVTDAGLSEIGASLARLAKTPGLIDGTGMHPIHGSALMSQRTLASEGPDGINLYLSRFERGAKTPVHDHSTWGVVHVLEGRDRHVHWERVDDGAVPEHANLRSVDERTVSAGQSVYWFPPPGDIHSQEALDAVVWELVVTGCDLAHATDGDHRHWFDLNTGSVSHRPPK